MYLPSHVTYKFQAELLQFTAVVVQEDSKKVIGAVKMSGFGMARDICDVFLHWLKDEEFYIERMSVNSKARIRCSEKRLTLGVVSGIPACRLYEWFGFVEVKRGAVSQFITCILISAL